MGAHGFRKNLITTSVRPFQGMKILDIGCGPADILSYLPDVDYWGFDISEEYIHHARIKFGNRGNFQCKQLDSSAAFIMRLASKALKPGGRLLTIDPCLEPSQNKIAHFLIRRDRGQNVRDKNGYQKIAQTAFVAPKVEVRHKAWIPYTHCFMECLK
jgi:SAM-dependent methyltransferase